MVGTRVDAVAVLGFRDDRPRGNGDGLGSDNVVGNELVHRLETIIFKLNSSLDKNYLLQVLVLRLFVFKILSSNISPPNFNAGVIVRNTNKDNA